jgi:hypothetical protein
LVISAVEEAELFLRLVDLDAAGRLALMEDSGLDEESRRQMGLLLEMEEGAGEMFDHALTATMGLWGSTGVLEAGMRVGRFEVLRELGRGGMGEVWLVEFEEEGVRRRGALKVLRRHWLKPEQMALWERERRLVARLSHPYIAGMIESGTTPGGLPFLLMEYVEGQRMDEALAGMELWRRVEVLCKVCDAVGAAHRQMVVHRDLKPGNVLITPDGLPKLVDFGIGQALDGGESFLGAGTKAYSSPEQLAGEEPTMASDIFSLGRMLEKVTAGGGVELEAVAKKATAAALAERYLTAGELEADLRRWLAKRPVLAVGGGFFYGLRCLLRRQPLPAAGLVLAAALVLVAAWAAWQQYQEAQTRSKELRALAGVSIFDVEEEVRKLPGSLKARKMLLESATKYLGSLEAAAGKDAALRAELADAYQKTGTLLYSQTLESLERDQDSKAFLEKAYRLREELGQFESREPKVRESYGSVCMRHSATLRLTGRRKEADVIFVRAMEHAQRWVKEEPGSWQAMLNLHLLGNEETRRITTQSLGMEVRERSLEHQRKMVERLPELRRLNPPEAIYWRVALEQNRLLVGAAGNTHRVEVVPEALRCMRAAVEAAEKYHQLELTGTSARTLLVVLAEYVVNTVDLQAPDFAGIERAIRRSEEVLNSPLLPNREASYWLQQRAELAQAKAWAAGARGDLAEAKRQMAECREAIDKVAAGGQPGIWVAIKREHLRRKEAELREKYKNF